MSEYLEDPSSLTKEKIKNVLLANNVELPGGNPTKDVYVQLYLKNLTVQNKKNATADTFSSDEELPPPVVSNRSRSSGRKATRKTDKVRTEDLDVTELTAENLKDELLKYGVDAGPIVASTRKLYEKKLQKLLDQGPPEALKPQVVITEIDINHNGNSDSDRYSDKEEEMTAVPEPEPEPEPEPVPAPVVERPVRSRGKTPVTTRTRSSQHNRMDEPVKDDDDDDDEEEVPVLNIKRRSRRSSRRLKQPLPSSHDSDLVLHQEVSEFSATGGPTPHLPHGVSKLVPKELRPLLVDQSLLEPSRVVLHRLVNPAKADSPYLYPTRTKLPEDEVNLPHVKLAQAPSPEPVSILDTALLEEPEPDVAASIGKSIVPQRRGAPLKGTMSEELSPLLATKPSKLQTPPVHLTRIDPITFSPMSPILPTKDKGSDSSPSLQSESTTSGSYAEKYVPSDVLLHKVKQQKISPFLSNLTPVKTHGCVALVSKTPGPREVEKIVAGDQTPRVDERDVLKELFPNEINTPTGISATCRRPIHGAAARPVKSSDLWSNESFLLRTPKASNTTTTSSYTETRSVHRVTALPPSASHSSSSSRLAAAAPPAVQTKAAHHGLSLWIKLLLLAAFMAFLFFVYQAMEIDSINPFGGADKAQISSDSPAEQQVSGQ